MTDLYILAGTYEEALRASCDLSPNARWAYVVDSRILMGAIGDYIVVGTFWDRKDARDLIALADGMRRRSRRG